MAPSREEVKRSLECPVCLEVYKQPKSMTCGHSICADCETLLTTSERLTSCPTCRVELTVPAGGFPINYNLIDLLEYHSRKKKRVKRVNAACQTLPRQKAHVGLQCSFERKLSGASPPRAASSATQSTNQNAISGSSGQQSYDSSQQCNAATLQLLNHQLSLAIAQGRNNSLFSDPNAHQLGCYRTSATGTAWYPPGDYNITLIPETQPRFASVGVGYNAERSMQFHIAPPTMSPWGYRSAWQHASVQQRPSAAAPTSLASAPMPIPVVSGIGSLGADVGSVKKRRSKRKRMSHTERARRKLRKQGLLFAASATVDQTKQGNQTATEITNDRHDNR